MNFLEFERPIAEMEAQIEELRLIGNDSEINISEEIERLKKKSKQKTDEIFSNLDPWQVAQIARHPMRPYTLDYINLIFTDFDKLAGDRTYSNDRHYWWSCSIKWSTCDDYWPSERTRY